MPVIPNQRYHGVTTVKISGILVILVALLIPMTWLPAISQGRDAIALGSQYLGMAALIAMAISQIIATRWPGIEALFGPMDQGYRLHKWLGIGSIAALLLHDTIDAEMRGLGQETALVEAAETAGEISLYALLILVVVTIATFIPYHLWKWTHRFIGLCFILGAVHYLFILKPFSNGDPLGLYMLGICALGTLAYAYTSAPRRLRPARAYQIARVSPKSTAMAVDLTPVGRALRHRSGQFAFFAFTGAGHSEPHPFTISSAPREDGSLRVTIAPLGDLTSRIKNSLAAGQAVRVDGPYGRFGGETDKPQVWIAAGVGITPFLALAEGLVEDGPSIDLIYAVRSGEDAAHITEIRELAEHNPRLRLNLWESRRSGRLTAKGVASIAGQDLSNTRLLFCGPSDMRRSLSIGLAQYGVTRKRFHYEKFEIRTGIGLRRLAQRIAGKF